MYLFGSDVRMSWRTELRRFQRTGNSIRSVEQTTPKIEEVMM